MRNFGRGTIRTRLRTCGCVCCLLTALITVLVGDLQRSIVDHRSEDMLFQGIINSDPGTVQRAIDSGTPPDSSPSPPRLMRYIEDTLTPDESRIRTSALILACDIGKPDIVDTLLSHGADPNLQNVWGDTPLITAVKHKREAVIRLLLRRGADIDEQDADGVTPLIQACKGRMQATAVTLMNMGAGVHHKSLNGETALIASTADRSGAVT